MSNEFKEELNKMETGSVALVFSDPSSDLTVEVTLSYLFELQDIWHPHGPDHPLPNTFVVQWSSRWSGGRGRPLLGLMFPEMIDSTTWGAFQEIWINKYLLYKIFTFKVDRSWHWKIWEEQIPRKVSFDLTYSWLRITIQIARQGREARRGERKERRDAEEGEKNGENDGQEEKKNGEESPAAENGDEPEKWSVFFFAFVLCLLHVISHEIQTYLFLANPGLLSWWI